MKCQQVRAWNCRRVAIGYWNNELICKGCLEIKKYYIKKYPNGGYGGHFTPFIEVNF